MLLVIIIFLTLFFAFNLFIALNKKISPIPYFPTNNRDLNLIIKTLSLKRNDVLFDLGSGDGTVILEAARKSTATVIGLEIHPLLVLITHFKNLLDKSKPNLKIRLENIFKADLSSATKIYLYVGPFVMQKIMEKIISDKPQKLKQIVSYMYDPEICKISKTLSYNKRIITGYRKLYVLDIQKVA